MKISTAFHSLSSVLHEGQISWLYARFSIFCFTVFVITSVNSTVSQSTSPVITTEINRTTAKTEVQTHNNPVVQWSELHPHRPHTRGQHFHISQTETELMMDHSLRSSLSLSLFVASDPENIWLLKSINTSSAQNHSLK